MRKLFLTFIVFTFAHIVFAQNKQTIVVRPETYQEKQARELKDIAEFFNALGSITGGGKEARIKCLNEAKNSKYSVFVEQKLKEWKEKSEFENTESWQKRLADSTAIKKTEIKETAIDEYAKELRVLAKEDYYSKYKFNDWFYDWKGEYDADKEVLIVSTFFGKIPIPIPLEEAKNMQNEIKYLRGDLDANFFIQNDQLALLSLTFSNNSKTYTWENPSQSAQIARNKRLELEQKKAKAEAEAMELAEQERKEKIEREEKERRKSMVYVSEMPSFPGGDAALMRFISKNLEYPRVDLKTGTAGTVNVQFTVTPTGELTDFKVTRSVSTGLDAEALRVVKLMPKWIPGKQNGSPVEMSRTLPIRFRLPD